MYSAIYKKQKHKSMDQSVKVLPSRYVDMVENTELGVRNSFF